MAKRPGKQIAEATAEPPTKGGEAAEKIVKGNAEALTVSGNASRAAVQELTRAYQELATKNAKNLTQSRNICRSSTMRPSAGRRRKIGGKRERFSLYRLKPFTKNGGAEGIQTASPFMRHIRSLIYHDQ